MPQAKLTKRLLDDVDPGPSTVFLWDRLLPRFGAKVSPGGTRTYVVQYRHQGRDRRFTIGRHGEPWTPDTARTEAQRILGLVAQGRDPATEKEAQRTGSTVSDLVARYRREHVDVKLKPSTARDVRHQLETIILVRLGALQTAAVRPADIARLHHRMAATPIRANRVLATLSKLFALAERWGLRPAGSNPCRGIDKYKEKPRRRYLSGDELGRLGAVLDRAEADGAITWTDAKGLPHARHVDPFATAAVRLLLLTGCRLGEILTLTWPAVDRERGVLRLADSKTGQKDVVLNAPALAVLRSLPHVDDNPFVIVGRRADQPRADLHGPWRAIRDAAGLTGMRLHDLRHSFASVGVNAGMALPLLGGLLGHRNTSTTQRYAHLQDDPLRVAAEEIGARLSAALGGER
jgi:integrase